MSSATGASGSGGGSGGGGDTKASSGQEKEKELDIENASRGVWLVKVPKYMSSRWEKASAMTEIGRLKITIGADKKPEILFDVTDQVVQTQPKDKAKSKEKEKEKPGKDGKDGKGKGDKRKEPPEDIPEVFPKEHRFAISDISHQHLAVFSQSKEEKNRSKLTLEGTVVQKGECRPMGNDQYMKLKMQSIVQASRPTRLVQQLDKAVVAFKPVSAHRAEIEFDAKKKTEGKKSREDEDVVTERLFAAFEKHQYYNIKDLEKVTKQPIPYLKEILKKICIYNAKNPHKNMWELKPEYRHYGSDTK